MDWNSAIKFLGPEGVTTLIICVCMSCCFCRHRQRGRRRLAHKRSASYQSAPPSRNPHYSGIHTSEPERGDFSQPGPSTSSPSAPPDRPPSYYDHPPVVEMAAASTDQKAAPHSPPSYEQIIK